MNATSTAAHLARTTWWPSPWGAGDSLGMLNHIDDAKRAAAMRLVRTGRMYDLGHVLDERVPVFPGRRFHQTLVTTAHHANMGGVGSNRVNWITEVFSRARRSSAPTSTRSVICRSVAAATTG